MKDLQEKHAFGGCRVKSDFTALRRRNSNE